MPHYLRFLFIDREPFSLPGLHEGLHRLDPAWTVCGISEQPPLRGTLQFAGVSLALLEYNHREEEMFKEELDELRELVRLTPGPNQSLVQPQLAKVRGILAVEVSQVGDELEATLARLAPLMHWLFTHRKGLKHEDGVGFSDATGVLLEVK